MSGDGHDHHEHDHHGHHGHPDADQDGHPDTDHHDHDLVYVGIAIVTVSTTRTLEDDPSGDAIEELVEEAEGAHVASRDLVSDDRNAIEDALTASVESADAVVTTGGTGISPDDVTIDVAVERFETALPGFGELFRRRSEADIGDRVMATRATAGVVDETLVFCLPGSENAARIGANLLLPQVGHLAGLATR